MQIYYHSLLWRDSIRKGADLEKQNWSFGVLPAVMGKLTSLLKLKNFFADTSNFSPQYLFFIRSVDMHKIAIGWSEPMVYGDALIAGYKIFINSKFVAQLEPEELTYEFSRGNFPTFLTVDNHHLAHLFAFSEAYQMLNEQLIEND